MLLKHILPLEREAENKTNLIFQSQCKNISYIIYII